MKINYIAFGSNLSSRRLLQRIPEASVHCVAMLHQQKLCWRKNDRGQSDKCDIEITGCMDDVVYGVIYLMTHDEKLEHGFPPPYVEHIRATPSIDDHDSERHQRELSIYQQGL